jgi:hypothetical protein
VVFTNFSWFYLEKLSDFAQIFSGFLERDICYLFPDFLWIVKGKFIRFSQKFLTLARETYFFF